MTRMAVVDGKPDTAVAARCRALGIKGFGDFARRYGRRITDLSVEKVMQILDNRPDPPTEHFPDRWTRVVQRAYRTKDERKEAIDEMNREAMAAMLAALKGMDDANGVTVLRTKETSSPADADLGDRDGRPRRLIFGQPDSEGGGPRTGGRKGARGRVDG